MCDKNNNHKSTWQHFDWNYATLFRLFLLLCEPTTNEFWCKKRIQIDFHFKWKAIYLDQILLNICYCFILIYYTMIGIQFCSIDWRKLKNYLSVALKTHGKFIVMIPDRSWLLIRSLGRKSGFSNILTCFFFCSISIFLYIFMMLVLQKVLNASEMQIIIKKIFRYDCYIGFPYKSKRDSIQLLNRWHWHPLAVNEYTQTHTRALQTQKKLKQKRF